MHSSIDLTSVFHWAAAAIASNIHQNYTTPHSSDIRHSIPYQFIAVSKGSAITIRTQRPIPGIQHRPPSRPSAPVNTREYHLRDTKMVKQPLTINMTDAGNLERLPPEIRKQIYTHLLMKPKTIATKRYINPEAYKSGEVARMNHHRKADRGRKMYD